MIETRKLTPDLLPHYLDFFDGRAFADNPDWAGCYCNFLYADRSHRTWDDWTPRENRDAVIERIAAGQLHGHLAFVEGLPVGWCGAGPVEAVPLLAEMVDKLPPRSGFVTCFVVAKPMRRRGIARALLRSVLADFAMQGLSTALANPRPAPKTEGDNHYGPLSLYLQEGFVVTGEDPEDGSIYVRKYLKANAAEE